MREEGQTGRDLFNVVITDGRNEDFRLLTVLLDMDLEERYGEMQRQYDKHNLIDTIDHAVVAFKGQIPAACGALKRYDTNSAEMKRIFVRKEFRKQGLAKLIVEQLERAAAKQGYRFLVLETGSRQTEAIALYRKLGYETTVNYGVYAGNANSICMRKEL